MKKYIVAGLLAIVFVVGTFSGSAQAESSPLSGWAWSSNIGWISFSSTNAGAGGGNYGVTVATTTATDGTFGGYAWSPNVGWVSFERSTTGNPPSSDIGPGSGPIASIDLGNGAVDGWVRAIAGVGRTDGWDGWIHLSGTNHASRLNMTQSTDVSTGGVSYNPVSKAFSGYAWGSDVVGWLSFMPTVGTGVCVNNCTPGPTVVPTVSISANLTLVAPNGSSVLTWSSTNTTSCTASNGWSGSKLTGGTQTVNPAVNTTYTITCTGVSGSNPTSATASVTVSVGTSPTLTCSQPARSNQCTTGGGRTFKYASEVSDPIPAGTPSATLTSCSIPAASLVTYFCYYECQSGFTINGNRCSSSDQVPF
jgi:hypothetical protein